MKVDKIYQNYDRSKKAQVRNYSASVSFSKKPPNWSDKITENLANRKVLDFMRDKLTWMKGEFGGVAMTAIGTGLVAPWPIAYNPFVKPKKGATEAEKEDLKNTKYVAGDFLNLQENFDYITWFLPFITKKPLQIWGLPMKYFCPEKMLLHAYSLLNNEGQMLIVNQGESEQQIQEELLKNCNIPYISLGEINSNYFQYKNKRYGFLINKQQ